jgi:[histone H4]-N-methyl-L-lysine20 N-methyltransferase
VPQLLLHKVIIAGDVEDAEKSLLDLAGLRRYIGGLRTEPEKRDFRNHLRKYINMYLPDCPFEVSTTNRYTITAHEAAVTARKRIREGDKIKYLCGTLVPLTDAELKDLDLTQRNFSIVQSDRKKNTLIFLGPARFANHDCGANGRLVSVGKDGLEVHATRNIDIGEEITVTYSPGYFGANNEECLCHTCELQSRNGWTSADAFGAPNSEGSTPIPPDALPESPYSFRKKRKHGLDAGSTFSWQSSSPSKKRKVGRPPSRLNQVFTPPPGSQSPGEGFTPNAERQHENSSPSSSFGDIHPSERPCNRVDTEMGAGAQSGTLSPKAVDAQQKKKRMRLIDQMTSSVDSSPELLIKSRPSSSVSDESGNDFSSSKISSHGTEATSIVEAPVAIKIESSETSKMEKDGVSYTAPNPLLATMKPPDSPLPATVSARAILKTFQTTLSTQPSSTIMPSIEIATPELRNIESTATTTLTVLPNPTSPATATIRTPGDYILTQRLIAQPFDRWVRCQTCANCFLQCNGYQTRRECPRCERHSMLYGFGWPKTEPDAKRLREIREEREREDKLKGKRKGTGKPGRKGKGKKGGWLGDTIVVAPTSLIRKGRKGGGVWGRAEKGGGRSGKSGKGTWIEGGGEDEREERVMDHRIVNRFIAPEEERDIRRRGKNSLLALANDIPAANLGNDTTWTPDQTLVRLKGTATAFAERGGSANASSSAREESVGSGGGFEEGDGALRRSKRYFGLGMTM